MSKSDFLSRKDQIITEFHILWSDPNSEIVKRKLIFTEIFPEILKPIWEN